MYYLQPQQYNHFSQRGFSVLELMVTISIVILITGIALTQHSAFDNTVLLKNQAYDIALDIRQVQSYGVGASGVGTDFRDAYGVYFEEGEQDYIIFQDTVNRNGLYDLGEEVLTETISDRFLIRSLSTGGSLSVIFERPNFDAEINGDPNITEATILIEGRNQPSTVDGRTITIGAGGYIAIQ